MEFWAFFDISDKPIKIPTLSAPQNDSLNLLFIKDVYLGAKKTFRMQNIVIALKIIYDHHILSGFFPQKSVG